MSAAMLLCSPYTVPTFSCIIGEDGTSSGLFALCVLSRAGVGAERPGAPGAQGTVLRARHLADKWHRKDGILAELSIHMFTWVNTKKIKVLCQI